MISDTFDFVHRCKLLVGLYTRAPPPPHFLRGYYRERERFWVGPPLFQFMPMTLLDELFYFIVALKPCIDVFSFMDLLRNIMVKFILQVIATIWYGNIADPVVNIVQNWYISVSNQQKIWDLNMFIVVYCCIFAL